LSWSELKRGQLCWARAQFGHNKLTLIYSEGLRETDG
jgi:hypothetical protein